MRYSLEEILQLLDLDIDQCDKKLKSYENSLVEDIQEDFEEQQVVLIKKENLLITRKWIVDRMKI
jgi:hypothetical protein